MRSLHLAWFGFPAAIVAVCIGIVASHWSILRTEYMPWSDISTRNPIYFYWPTAQVMRELETVRLDLKSIADGSGVDPEGLSFHIDVLISGIDIIVRPSELNDGYKRISGFSRDGPLLVEFATNVLPSIKPGISASATKALMPTFEDVGNLLLRLSTEAWDQDSRLKEKSLETIRTANSIILVIAALLACAVLSSLITSIFYWRAILAKTRAAEAAEAAVEDKMSFLAMISHELRTPLQVIVSALDVLDRPQDGRTRNETTARIRRAANSLTIQLRDMLTLARAQTGYIELQPAVFEIRELVRGVVGDYQAAATAKHLELRINFPDEAYFVVADSERIAQLLHNLISNAVKYTPSGYVQVDLAPFDKKVGKLILRLMDTGPGLPPTVLESNLYAKGLLSLGGGRGIGLSVVQTLLRQLGACMAIKGLPGGGTGFDLEIPAVEASEHSNEASETQKRVLIVDDHPDVLKGLSSVFEDHGFSANTAASGMVALNFFAAHSYSIILIDLDMPVMTGCELASHIRKLDPNRRTRLVAITAARHRPQHDLSLFDAALDKPVRDQQLLAIMHS
ncbi:MULTISPECIES: hybrid sensor histidine kinase/response regulator [unclassified Rhizobium]|nr:MULTISPECIES: response regulator [unclassified Rhizobium]MBO9102002.1 response regulator [Rhizobium sp. L58/93]MBO9172195.1 response regulator [Rhizobium sp. L245/93]MBO9187933.1 response regulator [Rhizobium sp. E27B/91]QXZ87611.1 response regulator [Rhizobium sp. K1/93]